jgi:ABC-type transport system involved in cytochrome bd biosynthesis fused ATPase/permease subunit
MEGVRKGYVAVLAVAVAFAIWLAAWLVAALRRGEDAVPVIAFVALLVFMLFIARQAYHAFRHGPASVDWNSRTASVIRWTCFACVAGTFIWAHLRARR